jgi:hypothetical protein
MRSKLSLSLFCIVALLACDRRGGRPTDERVKLDQDVTVDGKPRDVIFVDFEKNWRQFVSPSVELAKPVLPRPTPGPKEEAWAPVVTAECVFSPDARGRVPQVTVVWNEPVYGRKPPATAKQERAGDQGGATDVTGVRFDLALHHDGFGRNFYLDPRAGRSSSGSSFRRTAA